MCVLKNTRIAIIIYILSSLLISCKENKDPKFRIGVSQCSEDLWRETVNTEMKREASFYQDIVLDIKMVKDDTEQQIKDIQTFIDQKVDLLIIAPNESSALSPIVDKAMAANIPVILLDRKVDSNNYTAYIGADNYQLAKELGSYVADLLKEQGNIMVMRGFNGSTADNLRYKGFIDIINKYPNLNIITERRGNFILEDAKIEMAKVLDEDMQIDLIFAMNDPMAYGVKQAYTEKKKDAPIIIGIDALPGPGGGIEAIERGIIDASFIYPTGGDKVIELARKILNGEEFSKINTLYTTVVNHNNARILQLQNSQILQQQSKFDKTNKLLIESISKYSVQRNLFYLSIVFIILVSTLLVFIIVAFRQKIKANLQLAKQNDKIKLQSKKLQRQKDKLIELSDQLKQATNAKLVFFTNISHEFKTPLSLIIGPIDTLLKHKYTEEQHTLLKLVKRNSSRLLQLISEIIEFRSYENDKIKIYFSEENMATYIKDISSYFTNLQKEKKVILNINIEDTSFDMQFDKEKIEKIYFNLLFNAFKHVNKKGIVNINLQKIQKNNQDYAKLTVSNTGSYIQKETQEHIFNRYYIHDNEIGNTGIGLSLASMMVEIHKGKISVNSSKSEGTTFEVLLPFIQDLDRNNIKNDKYKIGSYSETNALNFAINQDEIKTSLNEYDTTKPLILIIEDNYDMRQFIKISLETEYNTIEASNGSEGIEKSIKYTPDLIISDIMMPEKNGFEVVSLLRNKLSTSHIPIILLTAYSLDEQKLIGFESGADAYIEKPFNTQLLKTRIRKLIESRQQIKDKFKSNWFEHSTKKTLAQNEQDFLDRITEYINTNISNTNLGVEDIALQVGLSKSQLYRKLKSITDYSPNELIKIIRLKAANQLLAQSNITIAEIAYTVGFSSPSYFTKCFKEYFKQSPSKKGNNIKH